MNSAPNVEFPSDSGSNNSYVVTIGATDSFSAVASQTLTVSVTNVNEPPSLTGDYTLAVNEGQSVDITPSDINFTDPDDSASNVTFTIMYLKNFLLENIIKNIIFIFLLSHLF